MSKNRLRMSRFNEISNEIDEDFILNILPIKARRKCTILCLIVLLLYRNERPKYFRQL